MNFFAGWGVEITKACTVETIAVRWWDLGDGGITNWMPRRRGVKQTTCESFRPTRRLTMVDRGVERTDVKFGHEMSCVAGATAIVSVKYQ